MLRFFRDWDRSIEEKNHCFKGGLQDNLFFAWVALVQVVDVLAAPCNRRVGGVVVVADVGTFLVFLRLPACELLCLDRYLPACLFFVCVCFVCFAFFCFIRIV